MEGRRKGRETLAILDEGAAYPPDESDYLMAQEGWRDYTRPLGIDVGRLKIIVGYVLDMAKNDGRMDTNGD
jgi:hypothetical protein